MEPVGVVSPDGGLAGTVADGLRLRRAAQDLEAVFLQSLLRTLRESGRVTGIFPRGHATRIYESLMDEEVARAMARGGGVGLADLLVRDQLRRAGPATKLSSVGPVAPISRGTADSPGAPDP